MIYCVREKNLRNKFTDFFSRNSLVLGVGLLVNAVNCEMDSGNLKIYKKDYLQTICLINTLSSRESSQFFLQCKLYYFYPLGLGMKRFLAS